jgi:hypothetical protein
MRLLDFRPLILSILPLLALVPPPDTFHAPQLIGALETEFFPEPIAMDCAPAATRQMFNQTSGKFARSLGR